MDLLGWLAVIAITAGLTLFFFVAPQCPDADHQSVRIGSVLLAGCTK
jgi:hypothetical protein